MEKLDIQIQNKWTLTSCVTHHIKNKNIKMDHRPKYKTLKFLEESMGENLHVLSFGKDFLDRTQKTYTITEKN